MVGAKPLQNKFGTGGHQPHPREVYLKGNLELGLNSPDNDVVWVKCLGILYPNGKLKTTPPSSTLGVINPILKKY